MMEFKYTNYRGETRMRNVEPRGIEFLLRPGFDYQPGWFLRALDIEKQVERSFALMNMGFDPVNDPAGRSYMPFNFNTDTIRSAALDEAAASLDAACKATGGHFVVAREVILKLKESSSREGKSS